MRDGFHTIQIKQDIYDRLDKIRVKAMKRQALTEYSWTNFLSRVATDLETEEKGEKERV